LRFRCLFGARQRWARHCEICFQIGLISLILSGYVRIKTHRGGWQLEALPGGRTFARYEVKIDLGGWVPGFLARSGTKKELPKVFAGLRRLVEIPPGQRAVQK
jgi:hypothetical protein